MNIWMLTRVDNVKFLIGVISFMLGIAVLLKITFVLSNEQEMLDATKSVSLRHLIAALCISVSLMVLIPSRNTIIAMWTIPRIAKNEKLANVSDSLLKRIDQLANGEKK